MKLQHMAIIFIAIFIPIILVTSYFISLQVETLKLEESYNTKLLDATYDAMSAFEINTANEDLSSVSDSLRSIIDASNNIFFNTLATNLGVSNASKSYVQPYVPAILYTLYDGYYIYAPTTIPEVCTDKYGQTLSVGDYGITFKERKVGRSYYVFNQDSIKYDEASKTNAIGGPQVKYDELPKEAKQEYGQILYKNNDGTYSVTHVLTNDSTSTYFKKSYILKDYIPYSARYCSEKSGTKPEIDIVVNYTLDNFITIEGKIGDEYYTKSGYLIDASLVQDIIVDGKSIAADGKNCTNDANAWKKFTQEDLDAWIKNPTDYEIDVIISNGEGKETLTISNQDGKVKIGDTNNYWDDAISAVQYYVDSYIFSSWVYQNLDSIKTSDIANNKYSTIYTSDQSERDNINNKKTSLYANMFHDFSLDNGILPFSKTLNDPENKESAFVNHKRNVIKNSITYNLVLSMISYTEQSKKTEYSMPILNDVEWDKILSNVSIVTFMQGMNCGLKYYNNYAIVSSTNNEISVTEDEIYFVPRTVEDTKIYLLDDDNNIAYNGDGTPKTEDISIVATLNDDESRYIPIYETAHRIDCNEFALNDSSNFFNGEWLGALSFKSKELKYDKIYSKSEDKFIYDHKVYTDYHCIVDSNYVVKNANGSKEDGNTNILPYLLNNANSSGTDFQKNMYYKLKAYRIAIAKERNNLYKTTAFPENFGTKIINLGSKTSEGDYSGVKCSPTLTLNDLGLNNKTISEIKRTVIVIEGTKASTNGIYTDRIQIGFNNGSSGYDAITIPTTSSGTRTLELSENFKSNNYITNMIFNIDNYSETTIKSIRFYFK